METKMPALLIASLPFVVGTLAIAIEFYFPLSEEAKEVLIYGPTQAPSIQAEALFA